MKINSILLINKTQSDCKKQPRYLSYMSNSIAFNGTAFDEQAIYNESEEIDKRIKQILNKAIEEKIPVIHSDIAEQMGFDTEMTRRRILNNPELKALWNLVIHRKPVKKKSTDIVQPKNTTAVNELILKIQTFLEQAVETNRPITFSDITKELNITQYVFFGKIRNNPKLTELWQKCNHRTRTNKSIQNQNKLEEVLTNCVRDKEIIDYHELSKRSGLTEQACKGRISRYSNLLTLWNQIRSFKADNKTNEIQKIKKALLECINKNLPVKIDKIAEKTGLSVKFCKHKIDNIPELKDLWQSGIHKRDITHTKTESEAIIQKIQNFLEEANKNGIYFSIEDIGKNIGIKHQICYDRIKRYPKLRELWKENNKIFQNQSELINIKISEEIEKALREKKALGFAELSANTGFSKSICSNRIYSDTKLRSLWNKLQEASEKDFLEKLKQIFTNAINNREKITCDILKEKYGISRDILVLRLKENSELKELWEKVKKITPIEPSPILNKFQLSIFNDKKIEDILLKAINEKRAIFQKDIAYEAGMTQGACKERIRKVSRLNALWKKVEHKKITDNSALLNEKIRTILQTAIDNGMVLTIDDIAQSTCLTKKGISGRFRMNKDLSVLFSTMNNNRANIIKQISTLKIKGAPNPDIQKELKLNNELFKQLLDEYERINKNILSHSDPMISTEEYMQWATLTKREFELAVTKLFEKMGYKTGVTRYSIDGGIDITADKNGKKTYIECVHNLSKPVRADEVLALQGCKHYFGADDVILVASSGTKGCKNIVESINRNSNNSFKVLKLEDIIKLAKKYNFDFKDIQNVQNIQPQIFSEPQRKQWLFKNLENITEPERKKWNKLSEEEFINRVINIFIRQNYKVSKVQSSILKNGFILEKDNEKTLLQYIPQNTLRKADAIRILYGAKDVFGVQKVKAFGLSSITFAVKDFINTIHQQTGKHNSLKLLSLDKIISMSKKL